MALSSAVGHECVAPLDECARSVVFFDQEDRGSVSIDHAPYRARRVTLPPSPERATGQPPLRLGLTGA